MIPIRTVYDTLLHTAATSPESIAVIIENTEYTYADLYSSALKLAGVLSERGLKKGDRVAIFLDNSWAAVVAIYGTLLAGGVFLMINHQTKSEKLHFILNDSEARILISDIRLAPVFTTANSDCEHLYCVLCTGEIGFITQPKVSLHSFSGEIAKKNVDESYICREIISVDLASFIYTSGSTGNPKAVMMTHDAMVFAMGSISQYLRLDSSHRIMNILPLSFDYGLYQLLMSVYCGATLVLENNFMYPARIFERVNTHQVTVFPGVPTIFSSVLGYHENIPLSFPSVTRVTNTAAALPSDYNQKLATIFPNALIYRMYGLTECKRVCYLEPEMISKKPESVGKAIPGTQALILTPDGVPVSRGETGILHVRGKHIMAGYWKLPEQTSKMLVPGPIPGEKMLCTHDHFREDSDGYLYFIGRSDDIIKTRGEKVSPLEVENAISRIDEVRSVAVIGIPDDFLGQAIKAFIVLKDGASLNQKQVQKFCMLHLENFMVPKVVEFVDTLPVSENGKIARKQLT